MNFANLKNQYLPPRFTAESIDCADNSPEARVALRTGNPHNDLYSLSLTQIPRLLELSKSPELNTAEAALDGLRNILRTQGSKVSIYWLRAIERRAFDVRQNHGNITVREAAGELLFAFNHLKLTESQTSTINLFHDKKYLNLSKKLLSFFDERLLAVYQVGSHVDNSVVSGSDADFHVFLDGEITDEDREQLANLASTGVEGMSDQLDLIPYGSKSLAGWADVRSKRGGNLIYGMDILRELQEPPLDAYVSDRMHSVYYYLSRVRGFPEKLHYPLCPPEAEDNFLGYAKKLHPDGSVSTKELVTISGWISTALVAPKSQSYIPTKSESLGKFVTLFEDRWSDHIQRVDNLVRREWGYRLPEQEESRLELREICKEQVNLENHFLELYERFLLHELNGSVAWHTKLAAERHAELFKGSELQLPVASAMTCAADLAALVALRKSDERKIDASVIEIPSLVDMTSVQIRQLVATLADFGFVLLKTDSWETKSKDFLMLEELLGQIIYHPRSEEDGRVVITEKPGFEKFIGTTSLPQYPHTDGAYLDAPPEIVALHCVREIYDGGDSLLIDGKSLYQEISKCHPEYLTMLMRPDAFTITRAGETSKRPLFFSKGCRTRLAFRTGDLVAVVPHPECAKAFAAVEEYALRRENQLRLRLESGDILICDNTRMLHGRLGFSVGSPRKLHRLWLRETEQTPFRPGFEP
ncbi:MAG: TauD/TfdA family dioxygenase [Bdellovibrionota bacterium]